MKKRKQSANNLHNQTMKQQHAPVKSTSAKKKRKDYLKVLCWIIVPIAVITLLVLDAIGIYIFNTERLMVLGIGLLIVLLPFFSEISVKDLSVKRNKAKDNT